MQYDIGDLGSQPVNVGVNMAKIDIKYLIYNVILGAASIPLIPYFLLENIRTAKYKKSLPYKLGLSLAKHPAQPRLESPIWIHALSVGEVISAIPLTHRIHQRFKNIPIVFSVTTETGYKIARDRLSHLSHHIFFFPLDFIWAVRRLIRNVNPRLFVLVETDIWPNFLRVMRYYAPVILVNARMSQKSYRRCRYIKGFAQMVLKNISFVCAQSELDASRFIGIGVDEGQTMVTGNIKFDQSHKVLSQEEAETLKGSLGLRQGEEVFVAGSTHRGEDEVILKAYKGLKDRYPGMRLIIAPRHPERSHELRHLSKRYGFRVSMRTEIPPSGHHGFDVIILNTVGELAKVYGLASVVFVGGSLIRGWGHNLLEVAIHKKPVLFGPYIHHFTEMGRALIEGGGGIEVRDEQEIQSEAARLLDEPSLLNDLGEKAFRVIEKNKGALDRTMEVIEKFIEGNPKSTADNKQF